MPSAVRVYASPQHPHRMRWGLWVYATARCLLNRSQPVHLKAHVLFMGDREGFDYETRDPHTGFWQAVWGFTVPA